MISMKQVTKIPTQLAQLNMCVTTKMMREEKMFVTLVVVGFGFTLDIH